MAIPSLAFASYLDETVVTNSMATATYSTATGSAGPYPYSNLGVGASTSLGADVGANVAGSTVFNFPSINAGQTYTENSSFAYGYTPAWSGGGVSAHAGLTANANFVYDLGPFSGNDSIFKTAVDTYASGGIGGGSTLTGGTANAVASGPSYGYSLGASAVFASASVGITVGLNQQVTVAYAPTLKYGYYNWVNTTGTLSAADTVTFHGVTSGPLSYTFAPSLQGAAGGQTFYDNYLPGVELQLQITPTTTVTIPLTGNFNVSAFGDTIVDKTFSLGNLYSLVQNYQTWDDNVNWNGPELLQSEALRRQLGVSISGGQLRGLRCLERHAVVDEPDLLPIEHDDQSDKRRLHRRFRSHAQPSAGDTGRLRSHDRHLLRG